MTLIIDKEKNEDKKISIAIMSSFAVLTIQYLLLIYFHLIGTKSGQAIQLISKGIVGLLYLLALPVVLKRNRIKFIGVYFIAIFIFILNYGIFIENRIYLKPLIFPLFFTCLPSLIYAYSIKNWDVLMDIMEKVSKVVFIVGVLIAALVFAGHSSVGSYSMSLSYYMLLPAIMYMNDFLNNISLKVGAALAVSLLVILSLGSRGAVLCIGVFTILKLIKNLKKVTYTRLFIYIILFAIVFVGFIFFDEILEYIYNFLLNYGIKSRSIRLFQRDNIHLSGRDIIYAKVFNEILKSPILGLGLAGDRVILSGSYAHNIFIELLVNFGVIIGLILVITLLLIIIKSVFTKDLIKYNIIIIWISLGFISLLVSNSYLLDFKFWILLGLSLRIKHCNKYNNSNLKGDLLVENNKKNF